MGDDDNAGLDRRQQRQPGIEAVDHRARALVLVVERAGHAAAGVHPVKMQRHPCRRERDHFRLDRRGARRHHDPERRSPSDHRHVSVWIGRFHMLASARRYERETLRGCGMAFSLIDDDAGAVPVDAVSKAGFSRWRETAASCERDWAEEVGFTGEPGKLALVPDADGRLGRVLVGTRDGEAGIWAAAGLPDSLPPGSYRIGAMPEGADASRVALGWALGTYSFDLYRKQKKQSAAR